LGCSPAQDGSYVINLEKPDMEWTSLLAGNAA
jgi:hypothetical protein